MGKIEILPWTHSIETQMHADLIKYMETLQKGSIIFIETASEDLDKTQKIINFAIRNTNENILRLFADAGPVSVANFDLQASCISKGLQLESLAPRVFAEATHKLFKELPQPTKNLGDKDLGILEKYVRAQEQREKIFVRTIKIALAQRFSGVSGIYVVCGADHAQPLASMLQNVGKVTVNTQYTDRQQQLQNGMVVDVEFRKELRKGRLKQIQRAYRDWYFADQYERDEKTFREGVLRTLSTILKISRTRYIRALDKAHKKGRLKRELLPAEKRVLDKKRETERVRQPKRK